MGVLAAAYVVLFLAGLGIAGLLNRGRRRVNPGVAGAVAMSPLLFLQLALLATLADRLAAAEPGRQGEVLGLLLGPAIVLYALALVLGLRTRRTVGEAR